jgi:hypothetical protein
VSLVREFRDRLLEAVEPFLMWLGRQDWPFVRRGLKARDVRQALALLELGDVILVSRRGAWTNPVIPGQWTHAMIYAGDGEVVEAVGAGSQVTDLFDELMEHDRYAIMRSNELDAAARRMAARIARTLVGRRYDARLRLADDYGEDGDQEIYCAELPVIAFRKSDRVAFTFRGKERLGAWSIEPQDYREDRRFDLIGEGGGAAAAS